MSDELAIINRVIEEHQKVRKYVKLVGDSITDREALASLQKSRADWIPGRLEILTEKQKKLQQTISALDEGLKNHFGYEEKYLPPILGELFMRALLIEHQEINEGIDNAKRVVADTRLEELGREQCLVEESKMQDVINNLCQAIEEHAQREEIILEMLQRALQEKQPDKGQAEG